MDLPSSASSVVQKVTLGFDCSGLYTREMSTLGFDQTKGPRHSLMNSSIPLDEAVRHKITAEGLSLISMA
jgi:hypothetical protein